MDNLSKFKRFDYAKDGKQPFCYAKIFEAACPSSFLYDLLLW